MAPVKITRVEEALEHDSRTYCEACQRKTKPCGTNGFDLARSVILMKCGKEVPMIAG